MDKAAAYPVSKAYLHLTRWCCCLVINGHHSHFCFAARGELSADLAGRPFGLMDCSKLCHRGWRLRT